MTQVRNECDLCLFFNILMFDDYVLTFVTLVHIFTSFLEGFHVGVIMSEEKILMPDLVDEMDHFLIWQADDIIIMGVGLIVGIAVGSPAFGIALGFLIKNKYVKMRDGNPRGYFFHRLRDMGIIPDFKRSDALSAKSNNDHQMKTMTEKMDSYQSPLVNSFYQ